MSPVRRCAAAAVLAGAVLTCPWGDWPGPSGPVAHAAETREDVTLLRWLSRVRWWRQPPGAPSATAVAAASVDSLTVRWTAPESIAFDIVRYHVQYRVHGTAAFVDRNAEGDADARQAVIDGLAETTTYEIRVRAVTELGAGDWSAIVVGTTLDATPVFVAGATATREIAENTPGQSAIGAPITATAGGRELRYALGGPAAMAFALDSGTGQLSTRAGVVYDHETSPRHLLTITAEEPRGRSGRIDVTVLVTDVAEPPAAPGAPTTEFASPTRLVVRWTVAENTGPPIEDHDLEYRPFGGTFVDAGHEGPGATAELAGLDRDTRHTFRVRARNAEGVGPWSAHGSGRTTRRGTEGTDPFAADKRPRLSSTPLPSGATATAGGRVETFRVQGAFEDPEGEILYLEASSRHRSIATASFEGGLVAVRPRRAGRATIAVTASDPRDDAVVGTFDIDVRTPGIPDPDATLEPPGATLAVTFDAFFESDERHAYEVALRQKAPRGGWGTSCIDVHNSGTSAGQFTVTARVDVAPVVEPGITYEVVYRRAGYLCVAPRPTGVWSRVAEVTAPGAAAFDLDVVFVGSAPAAHRTAFETAAARWRRIVRTSLPDVDFSTQPVPAGQCLPGQPRVADTVDDLRVYVDLRSIDGAGGTLALARTCTYRLASGLPVLSAITLDTDDLDVRSSAQTERTAMHEFAHALGFGTRWYGHSLIRYPSLDADGEPVEPSPDTHFTGALAIAAFDAAGGTAFRDPVPLENTGGSGSRDGHWRESVFGSELLSPSVAPGQLQPLSAITIQALADMGYEADVSRAEAYALPTISPVFAPSPAGPGGRLPGTCIVEADGRPVDDSRRLPPLGPATVRPAALR